MDNKYRSGKLISQEGYRSFSPSYLNRTYGWEDKTIDLLLADAMRLLGELNAFSQLVPNVDFFIQMHVRKEATTSSRIEGTKTDIDEAVLPEEEIAPENRDDWQEVQNYVSALNYSINELERLPLSQRLLCNTHEILLSGVRGEHKSPGEVRRSQNWIGGSSPADAFFVPPHDNELPELLSDLEKFWHNNKLRIPDLIKIAMSHYQFETIHPFLDGNGRIGRLLITLQLVELGILLRPTLYLSDFFAKNKGAYYDSLTVVRHSHDLEQWIKLFLTAVINTSKDSKDTFQNIIDLRINYEDRILSLNQRASNAKDLINKMYGKPVIAVNDAAKILNVTYATANQLMKDLESLTILKEMTGFSRNRYYILEDYVNLFRR